METEIRTGAEPNFRTAGSGGGADICRATVAVIRLSAFYSECQLFYWPHRYTHLQLNRY